MHLGWLVTTLGYWGKAGEGTRNIRSLFRPFARAARACLLLSACGTTAAVPGVLVGVVACTDYILVFDCEDSPEEANTDYDPGLIALLLWTCQVNFMLNKEKTYACHGAIYQSGAKNKGFKTQLTRFATWFSYKKWNASAFVFFTAQMNFPLEEKVGAAGSPLPCQMVLHYALQQWSRHSLGRMALQVRWGLLLCMVSPFSQLSLERQLL